LMFDWKDTDSAPTDQEESELGVKRWALCLKNGFIFDFVWHETI
jgi:hypothetical protein